MKKTNLGSLLVVLALCLGLASVAWAGWSDPAGTPPLNNAESPINISAASQMKSGSLAIGGIFSALQKMGIGTATPYRALEIVDPTSDAQLRIGNAGNFSYDIGRSGADGLLYFYGQQGGSDGYVFSGVSGEKVRITPSGKVGVGTNSPSSADYELKLDVEGPLGATVYCDNDAKNCFTPSQVRTLVNNGNSDNGTGDGDGDNSGDGGTTAPLPSEYVRYTATYSNDSSFDTNGGILTREDLQYDPKVLNEVVKFRCQSGQTIVAGGGTCRVGIPFGAYSSLIANAPWENGWVVGCVAQNGAVFSVESRWVKSAYIICAPNS